MASYKVEIKASAAKEIEAIGQKSDRQRIVAKIAALASEPRPMGCEKLVGAQDRYRLRVERFRIVYSISNDLLIVLIVRVAHCKEVYR